MYRVLKFGCIVHNFTITYCIRVSGEGLGAGEGDEEAGALLVCQARMRGGLAVREVGCTRMTDGEDCFVAESGGELWRSGFAVLRRGSVGEFGVLAGDDGDDEDDFEMGAFALVKGIAIVVEGEQGGGKGCVLEGRLIGLGLCSNFAKFPAAICFLKVR